MTEDFLHYLWRFQRFSKKDLRTIEGVELQILSPGYYNLQSGPDFGETKLYLGSQLWAGQLEIHIRSSDWNRHRHQFDPAYNSVVLHVVYQYDEPAFRQNGSELPTLVLEGRIDESLHWRYEQLLHNATEIACAQQWPSVADLYKSSMIERVQIERLEERTAILEGLLEDSRGDWEESFYRWLAYGFGLRINSEPMLMLARLLPQKLWAAQRSSLSSLEALFFGMAGFLEAEHKGQSDAYTQHLKADFAHWQRKYGLQAMPQAQWKWSRLRPPAFPELRMAQWSALLHSRDKLFRSFLDCKDLAQLDQWLAAPVSHYWRHHYRLGQVATKPGPQAMGRATRELLVINVMVPFLFLYGQKRGEKEYQERAFEWLEALPPENNKYIKMYRDLGYTAQNAGQSQALLQLYRRYCSAKKCLLCAIGNQLLKSS